MIIFQNSHFKKVTLGKRVELSVNSEFKVWDIVPDEEENILKNRISIDSPLIKLILGRKTGDEIKEKIGGRNIFVEIRGVYDSMSAIKI